MAIGDQVDDWQVSGRFQVAAAELVSAGLFAFDFYSAKAGVSAVFWFKGGGVGLGGDACGGGMPTEVGPFGPWSAIKCLKPFSVWDLNGAAGFVASANVGVGVTLGPVVIGAGPLLKIGGNFFEDQDVGGFGFGGGAGVFLLFGNWRFKGVTHRIPPQPGDDDDTA
jgi:hypothetical protein